MARPLVVDIDGTITDAQRRLDPDALAVLADWPGQVVVATGKALPYPVALCEFAGLGVAVVAENGGVTVAGDHLEVHGDRAAADAAVAAYRDRGYDLGWDDPDLVNRWRETEVAVARDRPLDPLREVAAAHGLRVLDTGFAYHLTAPDVDKGQGLTAVADRLDIDLGAALAVGDSENDAPTFERVGEAVAVANADETARAAADRVTDAAHADGFLAAVAGSGPD